MRRPRQRLTFGLLFAAAVLQCPIVTAADHAPTQRATQKSPFIERVYRDNDGEHRYAVFLPQGYSTDKRWPVILFLHGAGERGHDGQSQLTVGLGPIVALHPEAFPAVIVFPQVEETDERILTAWDPANPDGRRALAILADVEREYSIDPSRRILTGWSMGGFGTWLMAAAQPAGFWSSVLSISGGADKDLAARIPPNLSFWAIHGDEDRIVPPKQMAKAVEAAKSSGKSVVGTLVPQAGHDVWQVVYGRDEVRRWLLDPSSIDRNSLDWSESATSKIAADNVLPEREFQPAAVISRAVAVRIGSDAFHALSRGIPEAVSPDRLHGQVDDIERSLEFGGTKIRAAIRDIRWTAELSQVEIQPRAAEELLVRVGLKSLTLHCASGDMSGGAYAAACGPFKVIMGRRDPVWVEVSMRPRVERGEVQLTRQVIGFHIPDGNWFITEPEWARAKGKGLTPDLVKVGVVGGMYRSKDEVEKAVRQLIPPLIDRIEQRLKIVPPASVASLLWPLPTAPPRVQLIAEGIRTDRNGVSATIGLAVEGPISSRGPAHEQTPAAIDEGDGHGAQVGLSPTLISSVARVFSRDESARLDVRDSPGTALTKLGDRALLEQVAPALTASSEAPELRTVLSLEKPFELSLDDREPADPQSLRLTLHAPEVLLAVAERSQDNQRRWQPRFDCRVSLQQRMSIRLDGTHSGGRGVVVAWDHNPVVSGDARFVDGFTPPNRELHAQRMVEAFAEAWRDWTRGESTSSIIDDYAVGGTRLRLDAIPTRGDRVWLEFRPVPPSLNANRR